MRFILKSAFWLGLIAFLIPFGGEPKETSANITTIGLFLGAQQAIADVTGFCDRAPLACDTGRELAVFAGERIGDGIAMAYALVEGRLDEESPEGRDVALSGQLPAAPNGSMSHATDPLATGTLGGEADAAPLGPSAYTPPLRLAAMPDKALSAQPAAAAAPLSPAFDEARFSMAEMPAAFIVPVPTPRP